MALPLHWYGISLTMQAACPCMLEQHAPLNDPQCRHPKDDARSLLQASIEDHASLSIESSARSLSHGSYGPTWALRTVMHYSPCLISLQGPVGAV